MKKTYKQPMTDVVSVELAQLIAASPIENGGSLSDFQELDESITSGNMSLDISDLWD